MKINLDDPNLTAYALDELSGTEKAQIEGRGLCFSPRRRSSSENCACFQAISGRNTPPSGMRT